MASKRRNTFYENKTQETTEIDSSTLKSVCIARCQGKHDVKTKTGKSGNAAGISGWSYKRSAMERYLGGEQKKEGDRSWDKVWLPTTDRLRRSKSTEGPGKSTGGVRQTVQRAVPRQQPQRKTPRRKRPKKPVKTPSGHYKDLKEEEFLMQANSKTIPVSTLVADYVSDLGQMREEQDASQGTDHTLYTGRVRTADSNQCVFEDGCTDRVQASSSAQIKHGRHSGKERHKYATSFVEVEREDVPKGPVDIAQLITSLDHLSDMLSRYPEEEEAEAPAPGPSTEEATASQPEGFNCLQFPWEKRLFKSPISGKILGYSKQESCSHTMTNAPRNNHKKDSVGRLTCVIFDVLVRYEAVKRKPAGGGGTSGRKRAKESRGKMPRGRPPRRRRELSPEAESMLKTVDALWSELVASARSRKSLTSSSWQGHRGQEGGTDTSNPTWSFYLMLAGTPDRLPQRIRRLYDRYGRKVTTIKTDSLCAVLASLGPDKLIEIGFNPHIRDLSPQSYLTLVAFSGQTPESPLETAPGDVM
ncbi:hypothetical protein AAG570_002663 [Ranatra chinensis]|uniref:Uncharacterized protein n=1 Tax=Ranatra chinensis TaxID=642074 RepID=A0ABD0Y8M1_9HEMI